MNRYLEINVCVNLLFLWWIIAANFINIQGVDGIMCVQCSTLVERSEVVCKSGNIPATNCTNSNDTSCIKYTSTHNGKFVTKSYEEQTGGYDVVWCKDAAGENDTPLRTSVEFLFRGCDNKKVTEVCENRMIEGEVVPTCYYRCFSDGCNDAKSHFPASFISLAFILMFSYLVSETVVK